MKLEQWCRLDESIYVAESEERYLQYSGLGGSESVIKKLAEIKSANAELFLESFQEPRELYLLAIENIADARTKKLELELYNLRNKKISMKGISFRNSPLNWSSWRQFNSTQKDSRVRKRVFDEFIRKTRFISPTVQKRFEQIAASYEASSKGRISPLEGYLQNEKIGLAELTALVKSMANRARKPFQEMLEDSGRSVLGRQAEYYDDFYFFRNRVFKEFEGAFAGINPVALVKRVLSKMDLDLSRVQFDSQDRKDKYPSPVCFFIHIPTDIRVLFKSESPYFDLQGCFHETGHAMHASAISGSLEYWNRYGFSMGVAEVFSIFLERLTKNGRFLSSIGITDQKTLDGLHERNRFMDLFFVTFYAANSMMKTEYWRKNLSIEEANDCYAKYYQRYVGFEMPGQYWLLHHILPDAVMYVPSYLLAAVRAAELESRMRDRFGELWWDERKAGQYLREIMSAGAQINLSEFSRLDADIFMREAGA
ncbi:MAG: hypothetical protein ABI361_00840 [Nitrososphaera sp.]|jgi:hypothetical protein